MKKQLFILALFTHSLLQASDFGTIFMSATLFILIVTLVIALMVYLKNLQKENLKFYTLFCHSETPTLFIDAKGVIRDLNESAQTLLGYSKERLIGQKWYEKLLPDEAALQTRHRVYQTLKSSERSTFLSPLIRANGNLLEINFTLSKLPKPLNGSILTLVDMSKGEALKEELISVQAHLQETRTALEHLSEQFKVTFDIALNGIALLDEKGDMIYLNRALVEMFEYNNIYMKHLGIRLLFDNDESWQLLLQAAKQGERIDKMHINSRTRSGRNLDIDLSMGYLPDLKQYYLVLQDITKALAYTTELQQKQKRLKQRVEKDYLTLAYNRSYMEEVLERLMLNRKESFGFILFDIDHFKSVNDTYGHLVGDDVLIHLVLFLKEKLRKDDILARYGGEEFAIILPQASHKESVKVAEKLQEFIAALKFEGCPQITCSFGVTSFTGKQDKRSLIQAADKALYRAKDEGRNRVIDALTL